MMSKWFIAFFNVPFGFSKAWSRSGLDRETESNWDQTLMLFFLCMGGFLGANLLVDFLGVPGDEIFYDFSSWLIIFYFIQILRLMILTSLLKKAEKVQDTPLPFNQRLSLLLICLGIPTVGEIIISNWTHSFFMNNLVRGAFLVWSYILLYWSFKHFTNVLDKKIKGPVILVGVFDFLILPLLTYGLSWLMLAVGFF